jgi:hypothetical protein
MSVVLEGDKMKKILIGNEYTMRNNKKGPLDTALVVNITNSSFSNICIIRLFFVRK